MKRNMLSVITCILLLIPLSLITSCGGSGGGGETAGAGSALTIAEKVSVVDAQESTGKVVPLKLGKLYLSTSDIPSNSDYFNDKQEIFVEERSAESFDIVNEILCSIAQSKYDVMLNKGNYKAQIDKNLCNSKRDSASESGESSQNHSSGSTMPDYVMWTVNSSRDDNNSPHIVKFWVHEEAKDMEPAKIIYAKATITEGKSNTNPYGIFTLNFKAHPKGNTNITIFKGFLKTEKDTATGKVLLKFIVDGGFDNFSFSEKVVLDRAIDGSSGSGTTYVSDSGPWGNKTGYYNIAFNTLNFRRKDVNSNDDKCFSRTQFKETVWRYGLYDSTGSRVNRNSGFPIKKDNAYGYIGYYGLWFPDSVTISDSDTVYKVQYGEGGETATPYTIIKKGGRLKKHTKNTTTLGDIKNVPLDGWMEGTYPNEVNYRVKWDSTAQQFKKFAKLNRSTGMWENLQSETAIDLSTIQFGELNFWSQAIGGEVRVKLNCSGWDNVNHKPICSAPDNNTPVIYFTETPIFPGDTVPSSLRCYDNCPVYDATYGITGSAWGGDPNNLTAYNYTFSSNAADMILKDNTTEARPMVLTQASESYQWGFMSGPLFDPNGDDDGDGVTNLNELDCNFDGDNNPLTNAKVCAWKAWSELSTYYTWETGLNQWNQFTALKDSGGNVLKFESPLQVQYSHSQTNTNAPDYKYNGTKFFLEYSGFGNLWGIPGKCIDPDTGNDTNCGPETRWIPEFMISDGSEVSNVSTPTTKYLVKALEKEQQMAITDSANCSALTLTSYTLPSINDWVDPDIGGEPTVNNAPAVIGGVLQ